MAAISQFEKFRLLLWKNWILQWSSKWSLAFEILLPLIFIAILMGIRAAIPIRLHNTWNYNFVNISRLNFVEGNTSELFYSPKNPILEEIIKEAANDLGIEKFEGFTNARELESALKNNDIFAGVQFDDSMANINSYPKKFSFAIRQNASSTTWLINRLFPVINFESGTRNWWSDYDDGYVTTGYIRKGFVGVQHAVSMAYVKLFSNIAELPEIILERYPYPEFMIDDLLLSLRFIFSLFLLLCFIYPAGILIKNITLEKEKQLKEIMKMMGLQNWMHWSAWFVRAFITWIILAIIICIMLKIPIKGAGVLYYSDWSAVLFFLFIYIIHSISFCFVFAIFCNKASTAVAVESFFWLVFYVPYLLYNVKLIDLDPKWLCLIPNSALGVGSQIILEYETIGEGLQWNNFFKTTTVDDDYTLAICVGMMLLSSLILMIICLYVEQVFPGEYGVPKKWYFLFTKSYWCGEKDFIDTSINTLSNIDEQNSAAFEPEPLKKNIGLCVKNLCKNFGKKIAVKNVSLNMYKDDITVLLGHNGAGKTTMISMLTGMYSPTSGTAIVNGYDICTNTEEARSSMGLCPQHNVLFDEMSVANHIEFFSRLKGVNSKSAIKTEIKKYLKILDLEDKANERSKNLSGGMKRKLSMCCAFCGDAKVVLCDEPSSGMDPSSRRELWNLLQAEKIGRTILLTTHFMDEADILGDRIAIMCDGEIKCCGSTFFLKKKYGTGYRLICVKRENCKVHDVTMLLRNFVPNLTPESDVGTELTYLLPEDNVSVFEKMLATLENQSDKLSLNGYGIGISSMEEVFMKIGAENATFHNPEALRHDITDIESSNSDIFTSDIYSLKDFSLFFNKIQAMFLKKMLYTWRNPLTFLAQIVVPIIVIILTLRGSSFEQHNKNSISLKPMTFSLTQYPEAITVLESKSNNAENSLTDKIIENYKLKANSYGKNYGFESTGEKNFTDYILMLGKTKSAEINRKYLVAATIGDDNITAWLNAQPYHTAPLTVNFVHNAVAKSLLGTDVEITVTNSPLPLEEKKVADNQIYDSGAILPFVLCIIMCFVTSFYVIFPIKERTSGAKLLQFVSGVGIWLYWIIQFLWDWVIFIVIALVSTATIACFQTKGFSTFTELGYLFLVLILFGVSAIPFAYLVSTTGKQPASTFSRSFVVNLFFGLVLYILEKIVGSGDFVFKIFPHFSLAISVEKLYSRCCDSVDSEGKSILPELLYMLFSGVFFFLLIIFIDYEFIREMKESLRKKWRKLPETSLTEIDDDVENERQRIQNMTKEQLKAQNLVLKGVTKYFGNFLAVNNLSFGVKSYECFGLLGVNGAGKTTTFKLLTGEECFTYGEAYVQGKSLKGNINNVYKDIGYCPQFDALLCDLTGRETLRIFCLLRGVPSHRINELCLKLAKAFGFFKHLDKLTNTYSGGNKRKLSTALAVIGNPSVIYLDEPTTGMDPAAKRQLWNIMCRIRDSGKSIILTSHSMEECEALCTRLAIMVNGSFKCIGSTQHLKNKFSKGLILKVKIKRLQYPIYDANENQFNATQTSISVEHSQVAENVKNFIANEFPASKLHDEFQDILTFYIPLTDKKWSHLFGIMEKNRQLLKIEDYSISQTTLEEIFLDLAKLQHEDKRFMT